METPTPIFVVGSPRSGTTLTGSLVASVPGVCDLGEYSAFFFTRYIAEREFAKVPSPLKHDYLTSVRQHATEFASATARERGCDFYCDSTPWNLLVIRELTEEFPAALYVLSLRHYVGVMLSLERSFKEGYEWAGSTWQARAELWRRFYSQVRHLPLERTVVLSFDRMCLDPDKTLETFAQDLRQIARLGPISMKALTTSYATTSKDARGTVATEDASGRVILRPIPNADWDHWDANLQSIARPVVETVERELTDRFPAHFWRP